MLWDRSSITDPDDMSGGWLASRRMDSLGSAISGSILLRKVAGDKASRYIKLPPHQLLSSGKPEIGHYSSLKIRVLQLDQGPRDLFFRHRAPKNR